LGTNVKEIERNERISRIEEPVKKLKASNVKFSKKWSSIAVLTLI